jgi:uncharacterized protein involved in response to NO
MRSWGGACGACGAGAPARWKAWAARRRPVLWILHLAHAWIPPGLALLALAAAGAVARSAGVHALAVGDTGGLVLA